MTVMAFLMAASTVVAAPQNDRFTLVDFLSAMDGRCWAIDAKGVAVPESSLPMLTGEVEIECLAPPAKEDRRI